MPVGSFNLDVVPTTPAWMWGGREEEGEAAGSEFISQLRVLYQRSMRARELAAGRPPTAMDPCPLSDEASNHAPGASTEFTPPGWTAARPPHAHPQSPQQPQLPLGPMLPPPPCSFLAPGVGFQGRQRLTQLGARRREEDWEVNARVQAVDLAQGVVCGTMEALHVPGAKHTILTSWEGHVVDSVNHRFVTGQWGATRDTDMRHWSKFDGFGRICAQVASQQGRCGELSSHPYIYMRWKERCFLNSSDGGGLTIAGFYYIQLDRRTGAIKGYYFDPNSSPYQELDLQVQREPQGGIGFTASSLR